MAPLRILVGNAAVAVAVAVVGIAMPTLAVGVVKAPLVLSLEL
jgi:hypothetical protein